MAARREKTRGKSSIDVNVYLSEGFYITAFSQNLRLGISQLLPWECSSNQFSMSFAALWVSTSFQFEIFPPKELIFITSSVTRHSFLSVHLMMHVWSEMMMIAWGKRCSGKDCPNRQLLWFWESIHASLKHSSVPLQFQCQRDEDRLFRQLTCTCLTIPMSLAFEGWSGGRTSTANASAMIATTRGKLRVKHDW